MIRSGRSISQTRQISVAFTISGTMANFALRTGRRSIKHSFLGTVLKASFNTEQID